jgi:hypothetical protein
MMLFLLPLFQPETFVDTKTSFEVGLQSLMDIYEMQGPGDDYNIAWKKYIEKNSNEDTPLIFLKVPD